MAVEDLSGKAAKDPVRAIYLHHLNASVTDRSKFIARLRSSNWPEQTVLTRAVPGSTPGGGTTQHRPLVQRTSMPLFHSGDQSAEGPTRATLCRRGEIGSRGRLKSG